MKEAATSKSKVSSQSKQHQEEEKLRRGPWTLEEDTLLNNYVECHGEGHWNLLAKSAGLKRTGKSCRLRWLNYLKPDIKRGNLTPQEQLLILELHSKWGNRWSKIAAHLPGRTDNEIKNYWRTRVQKQARQLNMESTSKSFIDTVRCFYMPRLVQKIEQSSTNSISTMDSLGLTDSPSQDAPIKLGHINFDSIRDSSSSNTSLSSIPENPEPAATASPAYGETVNSRGSSLQVDDCHHVSCSNYDMGFSSTSAFDVPFCGDQVAGPGWLEDNLAGDGMWDLDELWQFRK